ncbi:hypothetical protein ABTH28_18650, partial [Acinetobacter baumannii]
STLHLIPGFLERHADAAASRRAHPAIQSPRRGISRAIDRTRALGDAPDAGHNAEPKEQNHTGGKMKRSIAALATTALVMTT